MDFNEREIAKYREAALNEKYEAQMVWQTFGAFLVAQTIFLAFLLQSLFGKNYLMKFSLGIYISSIFGLVICLLWMISFYRSMAFFNLRAEQARDAEPLDWKLLNGESVEKKWYKFSPGFPKIISKELTTRNSVVSLIWLFIIIYMTILILSGPWNPQIPDVPVCCPINIC